ncbi:MAG: hypothetical protein HXX14_14765 [Bacteroidetes bacterium]|nr:hypothetical protein [Bacteroidota bacterium]
MKIFSILMSIYILFMVSLPCVDDIQGCAKIDHKIEVGQTTHHHNSHGDSCSPFCVCSCCSVTVDMAYYVFEANPLKTIEFKVIPFYQERFSTYFNHIWQPPKLA